MDLNEGFSILYLGIRRHAVSILSAHLSLSVRQKYLSPDIALGESKVSYVFLTLALIKELEIRTLPSDA